MISHYAYFCDGQAELCIEDQQPLGTTSWDDEDPEAFVEGNAFPAQAVENEDEWIDWIDWIDWDNL